MLISSKCEDTSKQNRREKRKEKKPKTNKLTETNIYILMVKVKALYRQLTYAPLHSVLILYASYYIVIVLLFVIRFCIKLTVYWKI